MRARTNYFIKLWNETKSYFAWIICYLLDQRAGEAVTRWLSQERKIWVSNPGQMKCDPGLPTARHCCDSLLKKSTMFVRRHSDVKMGPASLLHASA